MNLFINKEDYTHPLPKPPRYKCKRNIIKTCATRENQRVKSTRCLGESAWNVQNQTAKQIFIKNEKEHKTKFRIK